MSNLSFIEKICNGIEIKWLPLGEIAVFSPTRIAANSLDNTNFVGVDNLVANKGGRIDANYTPNTKRVVSYYEGDILIGNIRPYLKKIWKATNSGGCSGDVLAIRIKSHLKLVISTIPFQKSNLRRKLMDTSVFHTFSADYFSDSL